MNEHLNNSNIDEEDYPNHRVSTTAEGMRRDATSRDSNRNPSSHSPSPSDDTFCSSSSASLPRSRSSAASPSLGLNTRGIQQQLQKQQYHRDRDLHDAYNNSNENPCEEEEEEADLAYLKALETTLDVDTANSRRGGGGEAIGGAAERLGIGISSAGRNSTTTAKKKKDKITRDEDALRIEKLLSSAAESAKTDTEARLRQQAVMVGGKLPINTDDGGDQKPTKMGSSLINTNNNMMDLRRGSTPSLGDPTLAFTQKDTEHGVVAADLAKSSLSPSPSPASSAPSRSSLSQQYTKSNTEGSTGGRDYRRGESNVSRSQREADQQQLHIKKSYVSGNYPSYLAQHSHDYYPQLAADHHHQHGEIYPVHSTHHPTESTAVDSEENVGSVVVGQPPHLLEGFDWSAVMVSQYKAECYRMAIPLNPVVVDAMMNLVFVVPSREESGSHKGQEAAINNNLRGDVAANRKNGRDRMLVGEAAAGDEVVGGSGGTRVLCLALANVILGARGAAAVAAAMRGVPLAILSLSECFLEDEGCRAVCSVIVNDPLLSKTLLEIDLRGNAIGGLGGNHIATCLIACHNLQSLRIAWNKIGLVPPQASAIFAAARTHRKLASLDFSNNCLDQQCLLAICELILAQMPNLTHLDLSWNLLGAGSGGSALHGALIRNNTLLSLSVNGNGFAKQECQGIAEKLVANAKAHWDAKNAMETQALLAKETERLREALRRERFAREEAERLRDGFATQIVILEDTVKNVSKTTEAKVEQLTQSNTVLEAKMIEEKIENNRQIREAEERAETYRKRCDEATAQAQSLRIELEAKSKSFLETNETNKTLVSSQHRELSSTKDQLSATKAQLTSTTEDLKRASEELGEKRIECVRLVTDLSLAKEDVERKAAEIKSRVNDITMLEAKARDLTTELAAAKGTIASLEETATQLRLSISDADTKLRIEVQRARDEGDLRAKRLSDDFEATLRARETEKELLRQEINRQKDEAALDRDRLTSQLEQLSSAETERRKALMDLQAAQQSTRRAESNEQLSNDRCRRLENEIELLHASQQERMEALERELKAQMGPLEQSLRARDEHIRRLEREIGRLTAEARAEKERQAEATLRLEARLMSDFRSALHGAIDTEKAITTAHHSASVTANTSFIGGVGGGSGYGFQGLGGLVGVGGGGSVGSLGPAGGAGLAPPSPVLDVTAVPISSPMSPDDKSPKNVNVRDKNNHAAGFPKFNQHTATSFGGVAPAGTIHQTTAAYGGHGRSAMDQHHRDPYAHVQQQQPSTQQGPHWQQQQQQEKQKIIPSDTPREKMDIASASTPNAISSASATNSIPKDNASPSSAVDGVVGPFASSSHKTVLAPSAGTIPRRGGVLEDSVHAIMAMQKMMTPSPDETEKKKQQQHEDSSKSTSASSSSSNASSSNTSAAVSSPPSTAKSPSPANPAITTSLRMGAGAGVGAVQSGASSAAASLQSRSPHVSGSGKSALPSTTSPVVNRGGGGEGGGRGAAGLNGGGTHSTDIMSMAPPLALEGLSLDHDHKHDGHNNTTSTTPKITTSKTMINGGISSSSTSPTPTPTTSPSKAPGGGSKPPMPKLVNNSNAIPQITPISTSLALAVEQLAEEEEEEQEHDGNDDDFEDSSSDEGEEDDEKDRKDTPRTAIISDAPEEIDRTAVTNDDERDEGQKGNDHHVVGPKEDNNNHGDDEFGGDDDGHFEDSSVSSVAGADVSAVDTKKESVSQQRGAGGGGGGGAEGLIHFEKDESCQREEAPEIADTITATPLAVGGFAALMGSLGRSDDVLHGGGRGGGGGLSLPITDHKDDDDDDFEDSSSDDSDEDDGRKRKTNAYARSSPSSPVEGALVRDSDDDDDFEDSSEDDSDF